MKRSIAFGLLGGGFLVSVMACSGGAQAPQPAGSSLLTVPPNREWLACQADIECAATWLSCHGWIAINGSYEPEVQRWYSRANAARLGVVECSGPALPRPPTRCHGGACVRR